MRRNEIRTLESLLILVLRAIVEGTLIIRLDSLDITLSVQMRLEAEVSFSSLSYILTSPLLSRMPS